MRRTEPLVLHATCFGGPHARAKGYFSLYSSLLKVNRTSVQNLRRHLFHSPFLTSSSLSSAQLHQGPIYLYSTRYLRKRPLDQFGLERRNDSIILSSSPRPSWVISFSTTAESTSKSTESSTLSPLSTEANPNPNPNPNPTINVSPTTANQVSQQPQNVAATPSSPTKTDESPKTSSEEQPPPKKKSPKRKIFRWLIFGVPLVLYFFTDFFRYLDYIEDDRLTLFWARELYDRSWELIEDPRNYELLSRHHILISDAKSATNEQLNLLMSNLGRSSMQMKKNVSQHSFLWLDLVKVRDGYFFGEGKLWRHNVELGVEYTIIFNKQPVAHVYAQGDIRRGEMRLSYIQITGPSGRPLLIPNREREEKFRLTFSLVPFRFYHASSSPVIQSKPR